MRGVVLAFALFALSGLSGCLQSEEDPQTSSTGSTTTSASASRSTTSTVAVESRNGTAPGSPPTARLTASAANGTAPLNVTFTLSASDPDGGALTWTLAVVNGTGNATGNATGNTTGPSTGNGAGNATGNGTAPQVIGSGTFQAARGNGTGASNATYAPANVTHVFGLGGNYSVVFTVSDGRHTATDRLVIPVIDNGTGAPAFSGEIVQTLSCWVLQGLPVAVRVGGNSGNPGVGGCLTAALNQDSVLMAVSFGAECSTTPASAVGKAFDKGQTFNIYCNQSVFDRDVSMDFAAAPA